MRYVSTRSSERGFSFEDVLFGGYAPDGGLYVPETLPVLDQEQLAAVMGGEEGACSYKTLCLWVLTKFIGEKEIPAEKLRVMIDEAFDTFNQHGGDVIEMAPLEGNCFILELFHGPTGAFKDLSFALLSHLFTFFMEKKRRQKESDTGSKKANKVVFLVGTSGDTGPAAIHAVRGKVGAEIVALYPKGRVSEVQELQMISVEDKNVHVYACDGTSDDLDMPIKNVFNDAPFAKENNLCVVNSINWGRVLMQAVHFFYAYALVQRKRRSEGKSLDGEVIFAIPTGACGNLSGGIIAQQMGLPATFVISSNTNDIIVRCIQSGVYSVAPEILPCMSSAIDIQLPYNWERVCYWLSGGNAPLINKAFSEFADTGKTGLPADLQKTIKSTFKARAVSEEETKEVIRECFEKDSHLICPHTAVAVKALRVIHPDAYEDVNSSSILVALATASPSKFLESVQSCFAESNEKISLEPRFNELVVKKQKGLVVGPRGEFKKGADWDQMLKDVIKGIHSEQPSMAER
eukprot:Nk52_evm6s385 gene=Nk52_evmTU6s385